MEMADLKCPLCGISKVFLWLRKGNFDLVKCENCDFVFIPETQYENSDVKSQYLGNESSTIDYYNSSAECDSRYFRRNLKILEKYAEPRKILDVGCSTGTFIKEALNRGWKVSGIEPNPQAVEMVRKNNPEAKIYNCFFDEYFKADEEINVMHMADVIEHVFNPLVLVKRAYEILPKGGILMVTTCDINSFLGKRYQIKPEEHLVYFNKKTLAFALEKAGFKIKYNKRSTRPRDFSSIHKSTLKMGLLEKIFVKILRVLKLDKITSRISGWLFYDEILILGEK